MDVQVDQHERSEGVPLNCREGVWDKPGMFTGVKVFSATKAKEREELSDNITRWLKSNADLEIVDKVVAQSSDNEFHCYSMVIFYKQKGQ
jgi:hypothetical protein